MLARARPSSPELARSPRASQERSQLKNKELAFSMLRAKLFALQEEERLAAIASTRKMQVGAGSRWEKI